MAGMEQAAQKKEKRLNGTAYQMNLFNSRRSENRAGNISNRLRHVIRRARPASEPKQTPRAKRYPIARRLQEENSLGKYGWKNHGKEGALARLALNLDGALVPANNAQRGRQAHAAPGELG